MGRLIVIGIDGMDADYVEEHLDELPNFRALKERGFGGALRSVFPTDSIPAWITIYTGIPPVEHGFLDAIDYFKKDRSSYAVDVSVFRGRTFWDVATAHGRRSCIINPFMAYPPWDIEGIMCSGPVFVEGSSERVTPAALQGELRLPSMGGIVDFPTRETLGSFRDETLRYTEEQHRFSMEMLEQRGPWDLFFSCYLTLDRVQHFYWRFHDAEDPTHPGSGEHDGVVGEFYRLFDRILGDYRRAAGEEAEILVLSDHGHGRRCTQVVNVNELLRRKGWLKTRGGNRNPLEPRRLLAQAKRQAMELLDRMDRTDLTYKIARLLPQTRKLKKAAFLVEEAEQLMYTPYFAGTNPCGGVALNRDVVHGEGEDYESLRSELIETLREARDERTGRPIFRWVLRREEFLGDGAAIERFPDVLFLMESAYGTGWDLYGDLVAVNPTHRKISGGHKVDGVLYATFDPGPVPWNPDGRYHLTDIAPFILRALGLPPQPWMWVTRRDSTPAA